jgi:hypothetical protein
VIFISTEEIAMKNRLSLKSIVPALGLALLLSAGVASATTYNYTYTSQKVGYVQTGPVSTDDYFTINIQSTAALSNYLNTSDPAASFANNPPAGVIVTETDPFAGLTVTSATADYINWFNIYSVDPATGLPTAWIITLGMAGSNPQFDSQRNAVGVYDADMISFDGGLGVIYEVGSWSLTTTPDAPVPEPSTIFLLGAGLAGLGFVRRRAKK